MKTYTLDELRALKEEYLQTLSDHADYADGGYGSDRSECDDWLEAFFRWLADR